MHPRKRLQNIIDDAEQLIRDLQYWNTINPLRTPMDTEPDRVILHKARRAAAAWDAGEQNDAGLLMGDLVKYAAEVAKEPQCES